MFFLSWFKLILVQQDGSPDCVSVGTTFPLLIWSLSSEKSLLMCNDKSGILLWSIPYLLVV